MCGGYIIVCGIFGWILSLPPPFDWIIACSVYPNYYSNIDVGCRCVDGGVGGCA